MNDDKLIDLETRIAYQDDTIQQLSDRIFQQQQEIDRLGKLMSMMVDQVQEILYNAPEKPTDEKPPHY